MKEGKPSLPEQDIHVIWQFKVAIRVVSGIHSRLFGMVCHRAFL
jgi:hypothetical protein